MRTLLEDEVSEFQGFRVSRSSWHMHSLLWIDFETLQR
jgi:hypothetical protein